MITRFLAIINIAFLTACASTSSTPSNFYSHRWPLLESLVTAQSAKTFNSTPEILAWANGIEHGDARLVEQEGEWVVPSRPLGKYKPASGGGTTTGDCEYYKLHKYAFLLQGQLRNVHVLPSDALRDRELFVVQGQTGKVKILFTIGGEVIDEISTNIRVTGPALKAAGMYFWGKCTN